MHLDRRHNLQRREGCSARPNPQHNPLNPPSAVLVLLDPLVLPPEQGSVRSVSNNSNSSSSSSNHNSNHNSRPGLVRSVRLSRSNRPGLGLVDSVPRSRNSSKPRVFLAQVTLLSAKSPPAVDSVRVSRFNPAFATDTSKAPQPQAAELLALVLELLARRSLRLPLPLAQLPNNPRQVRSARVDLAPVSLKWRFQPISLKLLFLATNKPIFGQPTTGAFGSTTTGTGTGIFGQQPQQQQPAQPTGGLFGNTTTGTSGTGLFGQQQQPQQTTGCEYINDFLYGPYLIAFKYSVIPSRNNHSSNRLVVSLEGRQQGYSGPRNRINPLSKIHWVVVFLAKRLPRQVPDSSDLPLLLRHLPKRDRCLGVALWDNRKTSRPPTGLEEACLESLGRLTVLLLSLPPCSEAQTRPLLCLVLMSLTAPLKEPSSLRSTNQ